MSLSAVFIGLFIIRTTLCFTTMSGATANDLLPEMQPSGNNSIEVDQVENNPYLNDQDDDQDDHDDDEEENEVKGWEEGGKSHCGYSDGFHDTLMAIGASVHSIVGEPSETMYVE